MHIFKSIEEKWKVSNNRIIELYI